MSSLEDALCEVLLTVDARLQRFGKCVLRAPIGHIATGFWLERSSDKKCRYVWVSLLPLFLPPPFHVSFTFGDRLAGSTCWTVDDSERLRGAAGPACAALDGGSSLEAFIKVCRSHRSLERTPYVRRALALALAKVGKVDDAMSEFEKLDRGLNSNGAPWVGQMKLWARESASALTTGALEERMLEWEDGARKEHKLPPRGSA